jgi:hypothetical protein
VHADLFRIGKSANRRFACDSDITYLSLSHNRLPNQAICYIGYDIGNDIRHDIGYDIYTHLW